MSDHSVGSGGRVGTGLSILGLCVSTVVIQACSAQPASRLSVRCHAGSYQVSRQEISVLNYWPLRFHWSQPAEPPLLPWLLAAGVVDRAGGIVRLDGRVVGRIRMLPDSAGPWTRITVFVPEVPGLGSGVKVMGRLVSKHDGDRWRRLLKKLHELRPPVEVLRILSPQSLSALADLLGAVPWVRDVWIHASCCFPHLRMGDILPLLLKLPRLESFGGAGLILRVGELARLAHLKHLRNIRLSRLLAEQATTGWAPARSHARRLHDLWLTSDTLSARDVLQLASGLEAETAFLRSRTFSSRDVCGILYRLRPRVAVIVGRTLDAGGRPCAQAADLQALMVTYGRAEPRARGELTSLVEEFLANRKRLAFLGLNAQVLADVAGSSIPKADVLYVRLDEHFSTTRLCRAIHRLSPSLVMLLGAWRADVGRCVAKIRSVVSVKWRIPRVGR